MESKFIKVNHMYASTRDNQITYYEAGRIVININHIISLVPHKSLAGYWTLTMRDNITYVVDHNITKIFGEDYYTFEEQSIFVCDTCGGNYDKNHGCQCNHG